MNLFFIIITLNLNIHLKYDIHDLIDSFTSPPLLPPENSHNTVHLSNGSQTFSWQCISQCTIIFFKSVIYLFLPISISFD